MKDLLYLHVPAYEELWYRQKIMQDPDTMCYNHFENSIFLPISCESGRQMCLRCSNPIFLKIIMYGFCTHFFENMLKQ